MTAYATSAEYATFVGSTNITATATATVDEGAVDTLTIGAGGGYGYVDTPAVVIEAPDTGVRATASATVANGVVSELAILDGGSGYGVTPPEVSIAAPEDLSRLLTRASELIDSFTRSAFYETDEDGFPTDADDISAFRDAACAQVEFWLAGDEEDAILGPLQDVTIGAVKATPAHVRELAPRAEILLSDAGLYSTSAVAL